MRSTFCVAIALVLSLTVCCCDAEPVEELGTTVYFVPKQHAKADYGDHGFVAFVLQQTDENNIKPTFTAHSAAEFVRRYRRLPGELQQYGIWLTLWQGDPYSPEEKAMLEELKALCSKHKLPLFIHIGPDDRKPRRFSSNPPGRSNQTLQPTPSRLVSSFSHD